MKHPDLDELMAVIQLDHEMQATIDDLEQLDRQLNNIIEAKKLSKVHLIKDGETIRQLAERYYGAQSYWMALAKYNGLTTGTLTKGTEPATR